MLNIISRAYLSKSASGPKKVVDNLIKGLDILKYPYVVNKRLDACERLWIHDDTVALARINKLNLNVKVIVGPNLYVLPRHIPAGIDLSKAIYLHPSGWSRDFWLHFRFNRCLIETWATGIDMEEFKPSLKTKKFVLIYFKQRSQAELFRIEKSLKEKNIAYKVIHYGSYQEQEYKKLLEEARYVVWLGRQESQGIALQEALSTNTPVLVCDVDSVGHWVASQKEMAVFTEAENNFTNTTSAPYFDERCGIKIKDLSAINGAIDQIERKLNDFQPRRYVLENLNLKKQARDFLAVYEKYFGLDFESGLKDKLIHKGDWRNNKFYFKLYSDLKGVVKKLLN